MSIIFQLTKRRTKKHKKYQTLSTTTDITITNRILANTPMFTESRICSMIYLALFDKSENVHHVKGEFRTSRFLLNSGENVYMAKTK